MGRLMIFNFILIVIIAVGLWLVKKYVKKDGTKKDDHFHIAVGWSKRAPDWDKFCSIMDETGYGVGNNGALCPTKRRHPYDPEQAIWK